MSQIIGQHKIKSQLQEFILQDRVPHALMFSGSLGRGGLVLAISLGQFLLCQEKGKQACGQCPQCLKSMKLIHPDMHFSFPVIKHASKRRDESFSDDFLKEWRAINLEKPYFSYTEWLEKINAADKKGDINVKECNEIIRKLSLKSFGGGSKVLILWLPEFLTKNANRLLKIIEEPPENTYIIFVADDDQSLLNTIISRFQILKVPPIEHVELSQHLEAHFDLSEEESRRISILSEGDQIQASLMITGENQNMSDLVLQWFRFCFTLKADQLKSWSEQFAGFSKEFQRQFLTYSLYILREFLKLTYLSKEQLSLSNQEYEKLKGLSNVLNLSKTEEIANLIDDSIYALERNANVKILMMADSLRIGEILRRKEALLT